MEIPDQIIVLIPKKLNGQASAPELEQLERWIQASAANQEEYEAYVRIWEDSGSGAGEGNFDTAAAWSKIDPLLKKTPASKGKVRSLFLQRVAVAASILLVAGAASFLFLRPRQEVIVAEASRSVTLPDGSVILLRKGSSLKYPGAFDGTDRVVQLEGEAFFQVARDERRPFHVFTKRAEVKVLGTSFRVRSADSTEEVMVSSGKVSVQDRAAAAAPILLLKGDQAVLQKDSFRAQKQTDSNYLAWKTGVLDFQHASMAKVMQDLQDYYAVPVTADPDRLSEIRQLDVTVHIDHQPLSQVLDELTLITGLAVRKDGEKIIFYRK